LYIAQGFKGSYAKFMGLQKIDFKIKTYFFKKKTQSLLCT
jgi:hypothetical protein